MIHIKHFMAERDGKQTPPNWKAAEDWLASIINERKVSPYPTVLHVKAYPSPTHHNMILFVEDHRYDSA